MMSLLNFHRVKKRMETLGDIPESPSGGHEENHTSKISLKEKNIGKELVLRNISK